MENTYNSQQPNIIMIMKKKFYFIFIFLSFFACKKELSRDEVLKLLTTESNGYAKNPKQKGNVYTVTTNRRDIDELKCLESKGLISIKLTEAIQPSFAGFAIGKPEDNYQIELLSKGEQELKIVDRPKNFMNFPAIKPIISRINGIRQINETENEVAYEVFYSATEAAACHCQADPSRNPEVCRLLNKTLTGRATFVKYDTGWKIKEISESLN